MPPVQNNTGPFEKTADLISTESQLSKLKLPWPFFCPDKTLARVCACQHARKCACTASPLFAVIDSIELGDQVRRIAMLRETCCDVLRDACLLRYLRISMVGHTYQIIPNANLGKLAVAEHQRTSQSKHGFGFCSSSVFRACNDLKPRTMLQQSPTKRTRSSERHTQSLQDFQSFKGGQVISVIPDSLPKCTCLTSLMTLGMSPLDCASAARLAMGYSASRAGGLGVRHQAHGCSSPFLQTAPGTRCFRNSLLNP